MSVLRKDKLRKLTVLMICFLGSALAQARVDKMGMARVISCVGKCFVVEGDKYNPASYRSVIMPGDEFFTMEDSYAWIMLFEGKLLRLSPNTQIAALKFARGQSLWQFNKGHLVSLSRPTEALRYDAQIETDQIFLPLYLKYANRDFFVGQGKMSTRQWKLYQDLFFQNKKLMGQIGDWSTYWLSAYAQLDDSGSSDFQLYGEPGSSYNLVVKKGNLSYRSFKKASSWVSLEKGAWDFSLSQSSPQKIDLDDHYSKANYLWSRIPSVQIAREVYLSRFTWPDQFSKSNVGKTPRAWLDQEYEQGQWNYRQLKKMKLPSQRVFQADYYQKALDYYIQSLKNWDMRELPSDLSSAQKHFWYTRKGKGRWHPLKK